MLAVVGAALGVLLAEWTVHLMIAGMPQDVARTIAGFDAIRIDARALGFTIVVAVVAGMLAGLFPALESTVKLSQTLKEGGRGGTCGKVRQRLRGVLVMIQVALAVVLLAGAGINRAGFSRDTEFRFAIPARYSTDDGADFAGSCVPGARPEG